MIFSFSANFISKFLKVNHWSRMAIITDIQLVIEILYDLIVHVANTEQTS